MEGTEVRVEDVREVGPDTVAVDLSKPDGWNVTPGQFVQVGAPVGDGFVVRHYTVSSPYADESFEITVSVDPDGELSPVLARLHEGDYVSVDGPFGRAEYEGEQKVLVVAGGPGVGPAVGIAERVADEHSAENVAVVYRDEKPAHTDRLDALTDNGATVEYLDGDEPLRAAVVEAVERIGDGTQVFVYGFDGFVHEATDAVDAAGYDEPKVENFG